MSKKTNKKLVFLLKISKKYTPIGKYVTKSSCFQLQRNCLFVSRFQRNCYLFAIRKYNIRFLIVTSF